MSLSRRKHVEHHKHVSSDIIGGAVSSSQRMIKANSANYVSLDANGFIDVAGVNFGSGYPCLGRNVVGGNYLIEVIMPNGTQAADMIVTGNLNVGRITGGLSVNGIIGLSGDLSGNCFIQFGTASATSKDTIEGSVRLARTDMGVLSIQTATGTGPNWTWGIGTLDVSNIFVDHFNSASGDDIYLYDNLRLWGPENGHKLFDSANQSGNPNQILTVNQCGFPIWTNAQASQQYITAVDTTYFTVSGTTLQLNNLAASKITSGTFDTARIPSLDASKIGSGIFDISRIPNIDTTRIPSLDASKIGSGTLDTARIPNIFNQSLSTGDGVTFRPLSRIYIHECRHNFRGYRRNNGFQQHSMQRLTKHSARILHTFKLCKLDFLYAARFRGGFTLAQHYS